MRKRSKTFILAATLGLIALVAVWLVVRKPLTAQPTPIGAILPLTGPGAPFGESSRNALLLAADELKADSTTPPFTLLLEDGMTDPRTSVTAFNRLFDLSRVRLFITTVSSVSLALAPLAEQKECLLFANASHPDVTTGRRFVLRYSNTAHDESLALLDFVQLRAPPWTKLHVIALNDDYGRAYARSLTTLSAQRDGPTIAVAFYDRTLLDFRTIIARALASEPDAFVIIGFGRSMGLCIRQLRELGYYAPFVASLGFILTNDAIETAGEAMRDGFVINFAFASDPRALAFRDRYRHRFGEDPAPNAVIDYGTLYLLLKALAAVGDDPKDLVPYLRQLGQIELPTGTVTISPGGDIVTPVQVVPVPASGPLQLWVDDPG